MGSLASDDSLLDAFEIAYGLRLPADFRAYMLDPDPTTERAVYRLDNEHRAIARVYRFRAPDPIADIAARRGALRGIVPDDLLAFARDSRGDLLCVGVRSPRLGGVFVVKLPRDQRSGPTTRAIAASFSGFLDLLDLGWTELPTGVHPIPTRST